MLGVLSEQLLPRSMDYFRERRLESGEVERPPLKIMQMRFARHEARRHELADLLHDKIERLRRQELDGTFSPRSCAALGSSIVWM